MASKKKRIKPYGWQYKLKRGIELTAEDIFNKRKYQREYQAKNKRPLTDKEKEIKREYLRDYYIRNPRKRSEYQKNERRKPNAKLKEENGRLKYYYGISASDKLSMIDEQMNHCGICVNLFKNKNDSHVDHDHVTNKVRGILCRSCNLALGGFKDNIENLQNAIEYLQAK